MHRNRQHEQPTPRIRNLNPPSLKHTGRTGSLHHPFINPMVRNHKRRGLLEIRQEEIVNENDILVPRQRLLVVSLPEDEPVGEEGEEGEG